MKSRFIPKKRTALDGVVWWYPWDTLRNKWSTFLCHSKHKKKSDCWYDIRKYNEEWKEQFERDEKRFEKYEITFSIYA